ncbi:NAD(P)/FAD-dependent oxidoreductase [Rubrobacter taiwanensis]|jgi:sulfide:quinone oxidoreductase|uniref:NAD(P)/FAD-dependent oxidoreductase n=1 Tax=Rubrobacter taiwanensis TaxID=185139 RepID=A0A4R1BHY7_9ACTN|nr:FAD/NAD(P)-binding oxidoreductase [Rubrobacter taiwanensis]TCJ16873.1 NAD(P)/FAD-dependent oxidoreductase [Rubrobacter taiwanensis]
MPDVRKLAAAGGASLALAGTTKLAQERLKHDVRGRVVIVGGGTAGISVAARLCREIKTPDVTVVEPSGIHAYQPGWTLVSSGVFGKEHFIRREEDFIPREAKWVRERAVGFEPEQNRVVLESGRGLGYDYLVVCPGHQLNYDRIEGLNGNLGKNGLVSNYTADGAEQTWRAIREFRGGTALFAEPAGQIKCGGAPQKIAYMADSHWRRTGVRDRIDQKFVTGKPAIFSSPYYREALEGVMERKGIERILEHDLVAVDAAKKEAVFAVKNGNGEVKHKTLSYDLLHFCPPQSAPDFVAESPLANEAGYVEVDKHTMQHVRYPNVFALGDASNLPTSKTGAAIRKQAPVLVHNLIRAMQGTDLKIDSKDYHGYSSCPLVTDYGKMMLAEFDYTLKPRPTFPPWDHDSRKETYPNWILKTRILPAVYWHGMLKGLA